MYCMPWVDFVMDDHEFVSCSYKDLFESKPRATTYEINGGIYKANVYDSKRRGCFLTYKTLDFLDSQKFQHVKYSVGICASDLESSIEGIKMLRASGSNNISLPSGHPMYFIVGYGNNENKTDDISIYLEHPQNDESNVMLRLHLLMLVHIALEQGTIE